MNSRQRRKLEAAEHNQFRELEEELLSIKSAVLDKYRVTMFTPYHDKQSLMNEIDRVKRVFANDTPPPKARMSLSVSMILAAACALSSGATAP